MKINEVADVVQHPAMKRNNEYDRLINSDDIDDLVAYVMDDNNPQERRLNMLRHLDSLLGDEKEV
jgi:succinate dehydrogenase flavin-adding protein (antitoxin of CptAB toxin-antitoxin module)